MTATPGYAPAAGDSLAPGWNPAGWRFNGPVVIVRPFASGSNHQAGALDISVGNGTAETGGNEGCAGNGFYNSPYTRGVAPEHDSVASCNNAAASAPLVQAAAVTLTNDTANANIKEYCTTGGSCTPYSPAANAQGTLATFVTPISTSIVAQFSVGMHVVTNHDYIGALTSWDPNGAWIKVDTWVAGGSNPVLVGYLPQQVGGIWTIDINVITAIYASNKTVTIPANAEIDPETGAFTSGYGDETSFFSNQAPLTQNQFDPFNESPRTWAIDQFCPGTYQCGIMAAAIGKWDIAFAGLHLKNETAAFLLDSVSDTPAVAAFVNEQEHGLLIAAEPGNRAGFLPYSVSNVNGQTTIGQQTAAQDISTVVTSPGLATLGTSEFLTAEGSGTSTPAGAPGVMTAGGFYNLSGHIFCTDGTNAETFQIDGIWSAGANAAAAANVAWADTPGVTVGTVTGWAISDATDHTNWAPEIYFTSPTGAPTGVGVQCSGRVEFQQAP